jgi:D-amino-acid dehydrogenase
LLILVDHAVPDHALSIVSGENVRYEPELTGRLRPMRAAELARLRPDVLITRCELGPGEAAGWQAALPDTPLVVVLLGSDEPARIDPRPAARSGLIRRRIAGRGADPYPAAFAEAEREWLRAVTAPDRTARATRVRSLRGKSVALVGAGVVNLLTALRLVRDGYQVSVLDRAPDPRVAAHWSAYGCSRGGGDARMFTLTEADGYYRTANSATAAFHLRVGDGGWRVADPSALTAQDLAWVDDNANIPPWLANSYTEDILIFNRVAGQLWREWVRDEPKLFKDVGLRDGILRLYSDRQHLDAQVVRQRRLGAARRVLTPDDIAERHPALREAHAARAFAGGIEVVGFTVQVHEFLARLVDLLEQAGGALHWERPVARLHIGADGAPAGLVTPDGVLRADHYVLSPGAYGGELLAGTATHGQVHGVLGAWVTVPNPAPHLEHSLKVGRAGHLTEDTNVTVTTDAHGSPALAIGSGYGWTGSDPANIDPDELALLYRAIEDTAATFFPGAFDAARRSGLLDESRKYCVRPWTASSLPILELVDDSGGGLVVVTAGHNTGGFAQAPVVAEAVAAALGGRSHPMHTRYHPDRLRLFHRQR